jgi:hypothetical protein
MTASPTRIGVLGDRRVAADVRHEDGDDEFLSLSRLPPLVHDLGGDAAGKESAERFALFLAVHDGFLKHPQPLEAVLTPGGEALGKRYEQGLDGCVDVGRCRLSLACNRLDRPAFSDLLEEIFLIGRECCISTYRVDEAFDDARIEYRSSGGDLTYGTSELVAFTDLVLEQVSVSGSTVRQKGHGIRRIIELGEDDYASTGQPLADLLRCIDAFSLEIGWHSDIGNDHLRLCFLGSCYEFVVVSCLSHDLEVVLKVEQCLYSFAHDQVVVSEKYRYGHPSPSWSAGDCT